VQALSEQVRVSTPKKERQFVHHGCGCHTWVSGASSVAAAAVRQSEGSAAARVASSDSSIPCLQKTR